LARRRRGSGNLAGVHRILYLRGEGALEEGTIEALPALLADRKTRVWVDIQGPPEEDEVALLREVFRFHPLALEDCFEARDHPKVDEYADHLYIITHGLTAESSAESAEVVELDAFVSERYLVTFHSAPSRSVAAVIDVVARTGLPLRRGPLAVLHAVLDRQADGMEDVLDHIADEVTEIEAAIFTRPADDRLASLLAIKRNILHLRRWMAKQREVVLRLGRREFPLVGEVEGLLFRDLHDHLVRYTDALDSFREMLASIQEAHLSVVSNRLNEVMKFLTMFTALLMPLTVITGIYGMNFEHMPELKWLYGYPVILGAMAVTAGVVVYIFVRRGWLRPGRRPRPRQTAAPRSKRVTVGTAARASAPAVESRPTGSRP
jgi:magnesium transporter